MFGDRLMTCPSGRNSECDVQQFVVVQFAYPLVRDVRDIRAADFLHLGMDPIRHRSRYSLLMTLSSERLLNHRSAGSGSSPSHSRQMTRSPGANFV